MPDEVQNENIDIEAIAAQMLSGGEGEAEFEEEDDNSYQGPGHPAWQQVLSQIPEEYHSAVMPTLAEWDAGVSRRFQQIHDEYAPLRDFQDYDPDELRQALKVYQSLNNNPEETWETIGRVYGLSPQQVSQATSSDDDDFDFDSLPSAVKNRLLQVDQQSAVLNDLIQRMESQEIEEVEAAEDEALEEVLDDLAEAYGEFDEDYVVGLIAAGVDPEEAVGRFQEMLHQLGHYDNQYPRVMSSGGGIPSAENVDLSGMSNQDTQALVAELLRLSQDS